MVIGLANPVVEVNDVVISIVPNSLSYKLGFGDRNVRAQSAGGGSVEIVTTENAESKISMVKFSVIATVDNVNAVKGWLRASATANGNTIRISQTNGGLSESFSEMAIIGEPETNVGADAEIEVEFMGTPNG